MYIKNIILYEICVVTDGFMSYRNIHSEVTFMKFKANHFLGQIS